MNNIYGSDFKICWTHRGQVLPAASLLNSVNVELIYEGVKYFLKVRDWFPSLLLPNFLFLF